MGMEQFAAIGVFVSVIFVVAFALGVAVCAVDAVRQWMRTRNEMVEHLENLEKMKVALIKANNDLQRRVAELEGSGADSEKDGGDCE